MNAFMNMDNLFQTTIIIFMLFLCMLCLFAVVVIVRDIIHESGNQRRERRREERTIKEQVEVIKEVPVEVKVVETPHSEKVNDKPIEVIEETEENDDNAVMFSKNNLSITEKYAMLSGEYKGFFDAIVKHVLSKEGIKEFKRFGSYDYKIGSYKVLKISIKRGEIICEFVFIDRELINYVNTSGVKMKQSATIIKVNEPSGVGVVKDGIDMVCDQIEDDKEYKKNLSRLKRKEKRKQLTTN